MSNDITNNELAQIINQGFSELEERVSKEFEEAKQGREEIKQKSPNIVYRFELEKLERIVNDLLKRVEVLEAKDK